MADLDVLTNAFLAAHPADAARVLDRLPAAETAALFERAPARLGAPVLAAMLPHAAARCLTTLEAGRGGLLLAALSVPAAAAALRHVADPVRSRLLDALPTAAALACRALLGYPDDAIGAWVDTDVVALPGDAHASEAIDAVSAATDTPQAPVFVVGADQQLLGAVDVPVLLRVPADTRLDALMRAMVTLPAVSPLAGAAAHPAWQEVEVIAVVDRGGRLVGALHRCTLDRALRGRRTMPAASEESLAGVLAIGYWTATASLVEAALSVLIPMRGNRT
jgi:magnesium transporter